VAGDFRVEGEITATIDPASIGKIQTAITEAMVKALTDPRVRKAALQIAKDINKAMAEGAKGAAKESRKMQDAATKAAQAIGKAFDDVRRKAEQALNVPTKNASLATLEQSIASMAGRFEDLANATREQIRLLGIMTKAEQAATRARSQEATDARNLQISAQRAVTARFQREAVEIRRAGIVQVATIRATSREAIQRSRAMVRVFELTWKSAERAVRAFARSASRILSGLARTVTATFRGIGRTISTSFSGAQRGLSSFARAVGSAFRGVSRTIAQALRRDEQAISSSLRKREQAFNSSLARQERAAQRSQTTQRGILGTFGGPGLVAGLAGGAGIGALLRSGFERAGETERLELVFSALLGEGADVEGLMLRLQEYARTTAFDFLELGEAVARMTTAFGDVEKAFDFTQFLADVVALTGGTTEQLARAQLTLSQVAGAARLDATSLRELALSLPGLPIRQIVADAFFGGDTAALEAAVQAGELGEISADAFFDALQKGVAERFPEAEGAAVRLAGTLSGMAANLKENFAIFGATIITLAEGPIKSFIGTINEALDVFGQFISGTGRIFGDQEPTQVNPFTGLRGLGTIPFEELPPEMQDILAERNGWGPGEGFVLAASHAEQLWDELHPPPEVAQGTEQLREFRDLVFSFAGGAAIVTGLALSFQLLGAALQFAFASDAWKQLHPRAAAFRGLLLLAGIGGLIGVAFKRIYDASKPLQDALTALAGALKPLLSAFASLGRALVGGFFRLLGAPDTVTALQRIGDVLAGIVESLTRGVVHLTEWTNWAAEMIDLGRADEVLRSIGQFFTDINRRIAEFVGGLIGITPAEIAAEGGGIAGLLRNTFLEPVVNFFTITLPDAVRDVWGGIGDLWDLIFGDGDEGRAVFTGPGRSTSGSSDSIAARLKTTILDPIANFFTNTLPDGVSAVWGGLGGFLRGLLTGNVDAFAAGGGTAAAGITPLPGSEKGIAEIIGNFLRRSIIDPIITFFTETLPEAVRDVWGGFGSLFDSLFGRPSEAELTGMAISGTVPSSGQFGFLTPLWDSLTNFKNNVETLGLGDAFGEIWQGIIDSAGKIWDDGAGGGLSAELAKLPGLITGFFSDLKWSEILVIGGAAAIGTAAAGPVGGVIAGGAAAGGVASGLIDPIVEGIESGKASILTALDNNIWTPIKDWFMTTFTVDNLIKAGVEFTVWVNDVGTEIGKAFGSDEFQIAVAAAVGGAAAFAGAVSAILVAFGAGLVTGLSGAVVQWSTDIGAFIGSAFQLAADNFDLPEGWGVTIANVIGNEVTGAAALAALAVFGPRIIAGLFTAVTGGIRGLPATLAFGATNLISLLFGRKSPQQVGNELGQSPILKSLGAKMVAGIAAGFVTFELGRVAGERGTTGSLILSILQGTITGGAIGLQFGIIGAAVGAGFGLLTSLAGNFFGRMQADAEDAQTAIDQLAGSLRGLSDSDLVAALGRELRTSVFEDLEPGEFADWGEAMIEFGFNFPQLAADIVAGTAQVDDALAGFVAGMRDNLVDALAASEDWSLGRGEAARIIDDFIANLTEAAAGADFTDVNQLIGEAVAGMAGDAGANLETVEIALEGLGLTVGDLGNIMAFTEGKIRVSAGTIKFLGQEAEVAATSVDTMQEGAAALRSILDQPLSAGNTLAEINRLLSDSELTEPEQFQLIEDAARETESALQDAKTALSEFLTAQFQRPEIPTFEAARAQVQFEIDTVALQESFQAAATQAAEGGIVAQADVTVLATADSVRGFESMWAGLVNDAVASGAIANPEQYNALVQTAIDEITRGMQEGDLDEGLGNALVAALEAATLTPEELAAAGGDFFAALLDATTNAEAIRTKMAENQATAAEALANTETLPQGVMNPFFGAAFDAEQYRPLVESEVSKLRGYASDVLGTGMTSSELTGAVISSAGGPTEVDVGAGEIGTSIVGDIIAAVETGASDVRDAASALGVAFADGLGGEGGRIIGVAELIVAGVLAELSSAVQAAGLYGTATGSGFASGLGSQGQSAVNTANFIAAVTVAQFANYVDDAFVIGARISEGVERGIRSRISGIIAAAIAAVTAAINAARAALGIASPSKVFVNIGRDIGRGFIQGIKDAEGDMAAAMTDALSGAVEKAVRTTGAKVERVAAAGRIFELLAPSVLPGGATTAAVQLAQLRQTVSARGFRAELQAGAAERFADTGTRALVEAALAMRDAVRNLDETLVRNAADAFDASVASALIEALGEMNNSVRTLTTTLDEQVTDAFDATSRQSLAEAAAEMGAAATTLAAALTETAGTTLAGLGSESFDQARAAIRNLGRDVGAFVTDARKALSEAREAKPADRTYLQQQLIAGGAFTLDPQWAQGMANREAIFGFLTQIRNWGTEAIAAGQSLPDVIANMKQFRDSLIGQLKAYGFNITHVKNLVAAFGLSDAALSEFAASLTDLNQATEAGRANREAIVESFEAIRNWGTEALAAGRNVTAVVDKMKEQRNALVEELKERGFNTDAIARIVEALGLSNAALSEFATSLVTLNQATEAGRANREAIVESLEAVRTWGSEALAAGRNVTAVVDKMKEQRNAIVAELRERGFNTDAIARIVDQLGLSNTALNEFATTIASLSEATEVGRANREAVVESFEAIRAWGEEALRAGRSAKDVVAQMQLQRNELSAELRARGFNTDAVNAIITQLGLSNTALAKFRAELVTLNTATVAGAENRIKLLEQFRGIRDFAQQMIDAGIPIADVIGNVRTLRDQLVNQAVAFGFNRKQVETLVDIIGLSNTQLGEFIKQFNNFNTAAAGAEKVAADAAKAAAAREKAEAEREAREAREKALAESKAIVNRPTIERLIVQLPTGDPEANALAVWNRFSYSSPYG
jgi:hypothetical protein